MHTDQTVNLKSILYQGFKGEKIMLLLKNQYLTLKSKEFSLGVHVCILLSYTVDVLVSMGKECCM